LREIKGKPGVRGRLLQQLPEPVVSKRTRQHCAADHVEEHHGTAAVNAEIVVFPLVGAGSQVVVDIASQVVDTDSTDTDSEDRQVG